MVGSVDKITQVICPSHHHIMLLGDLDSLMGWTGWAAASPATRELSVARLYCDFKYRFLNTFG